LDARFFISINFFSTIRQQRPQPKKRLSKESQTNVENLLQSRQHRSDIAPNRQGTISQRVAVVAVQFGIAPNMPLASLDKNPVISCISGHSAHRTRSCGVNDCGRNSNLRPYRLLAGSRPLQTPESRPPIAQR
jgi:hypothetical protein